MKKSLADRGRGWISIPVTARLANAIVRGASGTPDLVEGVGDPVGEQRLHARPAGEDLDRADAARGGIAIARGGDVEPTSLHDAPQCSQPEHLKVRRPPTRAEEGQRHVALAAVGRRS